MTKRLRYFLVGAATMMAMLALKPQSVAACENAGTCGPSGGNCMQMCYYEDNWSSWYDVDCGSYYPTPHSCVDHNYNFYGTTWVKNEGDSLKDRLANALASVVVYAQSCQDTFCDWGWCQYCEGLNA